MPSVASSGTILALPAPDGPPSMSRVFPVGPTMSVPAPVPMSTKKILAVGGS
jgi:hypothetical protein